MSPHGKVPLQWGGTCSCAELWCRPYSSTGTIPSPNVSGCPLSKTNTLSPWQAGICMTQSGTAGEDKISGGKDLVSPRYPWMSQQLPAHVREPLHLHLFLLFCFLSPRIFSPLGLSGPVNFVSNAVQHCWSHHAPAWELLLPAW